MRGLFLLQPGTGTRYPRFAQRRMRSLFRQQEFLAYFLARQSSLLAYSIEGVAIAWQIFSLRHRAFDLGMVGLTLFLPQLLLALPAGLAADRFDRRTIVLVVAGIPAVALATLMMLALSGSHSVAAYFAAVAFVGIAHAFEAPAQRSLLPVIVPGERFVRAQALSSSMGQLMQIGGPALAGVLIALNVPIPLGTAGALYVITACSFSFLHRRTVPADDMPLAQAAIEGVRYIFARKIILGAISLDLFAVLFGGATALLPIYAIAILHVGPTGFGLLRSAPAIGAGLVAAFLARRPLERHAGPTLFWCVAGFGLATIVFGVSKNFAVSMIALLLTGGFDMVSVVIRIALVQLGTPNAMRGRVSAVENVFIGASNELGEFESGTLAGFIGAEAAVVVGGIATLAVILLWAGWFPGLRRFDRLSAGRLEA